MVFEQFYLGCLAHASYLIGSDGVAAVVDPQRDVDIYLETARQHGLRIAHIIETHLHADFVSGHQELAQRTGATIYLGEGSGATFEHRAVHDGHTIGFGRCRLRFLQTPGHTLESVSVVVTDLERGNSPVAVLTGDTLFIGDVGRPDLSDTHTPQQLARLLYHSLHRKLLSLPDDVAVYPAHGAGSMCGRNISADRSSTIGRERASNYALQPMTAEQFVELTTQDLPSRPEYFRRDVDVNRHGAAALDTLPPMAALAPAEVATRQRAGVTVLDTRTPMLFCSGHVPGSVNIGLSGQFASWAGSVLGLDRELILLADDDREAGEARMRLARVGIERVEGMVEGGISGWAGASQPLEHTDQITVQELEPRRQELLVVDVRRASEWKGEGHIPGAVMRPLDKLSETMRDLPRDRPLAVHCKSGYRSAIACSLLQAGGFEHVMNVQGGFDAWVRAGFAVEK
jgi:glyoxylase-like metal-dependent hydrolase (beta-lactamase superfamily II)/rhodanese-related sulfurtransferase